LTLDLSGITAINTDNQELAALTGGLEGFAAMKFLHSSKGVRFVIFTDHSFIRLLYNDTHYWINVDIDSSDYVSTDDILSAAFCCSYIRERDPSWDFCFATGALRATFETKVNRS
jgi:hypothetical protein